MIIRENEIDTTIVLSTDSLADILLILNVELYKEREKLAFYSMHDGLEEAAIIVRDRILNLECAYRQLTARGR